MIKARVWHVLAILTLVLLILITAACGNGISKSEYQALEIERNSLQSELVSTKGSVDSLTLELTKTQTDKEELSKELATTKTELDKLSNDLTTRKTELDKLSNDLTTTRTNLDLIQSQLTQTQNELSGMKTLYPPKPFSTIADLRDWVNKNYVPRTSADAIMWYLSGIELQKKALRDGYIINVNLTLTSENPDKYTVLVDTVLADGSLYWWDPETANIHYWLDVNRF